MDHILILCLYFWRKEKNIYSSDRAYLALLHSRLTPSMAAVLKKAHKETLIFRQFETRDSLFAASHWGSQNHLCSFAPQEGIQVFTASLSHGMEVRGDARISAFLQHQGPGPLYPHCSILWGWGGFGAHRCWRKNRIPLVPDPSVFFWGVSFLCLFNLLDTSGFLFSVYSWVCQTVLVLVGALWMEHPGLLCSSMS